MYVRDLQSVDYVGVLVSELVPLDRQIVLGRKRRGVESAKHDEDAHRTIAGIEYLNRDAFSVRKVKADHQPLRRVEWMPMLSWRRLDEQFYKRPPIVGRPEYGRVRFDAGRERNAEERCLHLRDFGEQMIDEVSLRELLTDRVGPGHDLDRGHL